MRPRAPHARARKRLVESLDALPDTTTALSSGEITMDEARHIASVATEDTEQEWLSGVPWYTAPDVARLVELASRGVPVLQIASGVLDKLFDALELNDPRHLCRPSATDAGTPPPGRPQRPCRGRKVVPRPRVPRAPPGVERGGGRIKERACQNPDRRV